MGVVQSGLDHETGHFNYLCIHDRHSREDGNPVNSATFATSGPPPPRGDGGGGLGHRLGHYGQQPTACDGHCSRENLPCPLFLKEGDSYCIQFTLT